jgi:hypothetical protein
MQQFHRANIQASNSALGSVHGMQSLSQLRK